MADVLDTIIVRNSEPIIDLSGFGGAGKRCGPQESNKYHYIIGAANPVVLTVYDDSYLTGRLPVSSRTLAAKLADGIRQKYPSYQVSTNNDTITVRRDEAAPLDIVDRSVERRLYIDRLVYTHPSGFSLPRAITACPTVDKAVSTLVITTEPYSYADNPPEVESGFGYGAWGAPADSNLDAGYSQKPEAIAYIKQADYATTYKLIINGIPASIVTPDATSSGARAGLDTLSLASQLVNSVNSGTGNHGVWATLHGSTIKLVPVDGVSDFTIQASDSLGDRALFAFKHVAQNFSELPPSAPDGFRLKIIGEPDSAEEAYHVVFKTEDDTTKGIWEETVAPGIPTHLVRETMPHILTRKQNADYVTQDNPHGIYFEFDLAPFKPRKVGDYATAPWPSFCSRQDDSGAIIVKRFITSMAYHKNRLVFATDENLVFSEAGNYFNFFPTTVITPLESDAIDVAMNNEKVTPIRHMVGTQDELLLFAYNQQYAVRGGEVFSGETIRITPVSEYDMDDKVAPILAGDAIFYVNKRRNFNAIWEYATESEESFTSTNVTRHVPNYIPGSVHKIVSSSTQDSLFVLPRLSHGQPQNVLYVFDYMWRNNERVQAAWHRWEFAGEIVDINLDGNYLTLITRYNEGGTFKYYIEGINLKYDKLAQELNHPVYLDRREEITGQPNPVLASWDTRQIKNFQGRKFIGFPYAQLYTFSRLYPRAERQVLVGGRTQARRLILSYANTSHFQVYVSVDGRTGYKVLEFNGRLLGSFSSLIGSIPVETDEFTVPLLSRTDKLSISIVNNSVFEAQFQSAVWEGYHVYRARRL